MGGRAGGRAGGPAGGPAGGRADGWMDGTDNNIPNFFLKKWGYDYTILSKVKKRAKIRNQYNQVPHLTQDTSGKVTDSQLDITNESQEVSPFPAGDHEASINRCARKHNKQKTEVT